MATRSEDGWKVNLTDLSEPNDLYIIVSNGAKKSMALSYDPIASVVLAYDGDWRKVFKRNTMTTFYGSKGFGMAQQHMDDLMERCDWRSCRRSASSIRSVRHGRSTKPLRASSPTMRAKPSRMSFRFP